MSKSALQAGRKATVRRPTLIWLTALVALCIVVLALWLPFGLRRAAWGDAWTYYGWQLAGQTLAPLANSRPLNWLPWVISYTLAPASFLGMNLLIAWLVLAKGALVYAIVRQLAPPATGLALAAALLALVYPAEVGYFFDGFINLHQGFDAYLLALFFLLAHRKRRSAWLLIAAVAALAFSVFTYEAVLALAAATPLLLVWQERRLSRRLVRVSLLWLLPVVAYVVYVGLLALSAAGLETREAGLLSAGLNVPNLPLEVLQANLWNLGRRYFEGWREALTLSPFNGSSPLFIIALATGFMAGAVTFAHARLAQKSIVAIPHGWTRRRWLELFALSILWTALGYAVFSLASVRYDGWRLGFYTVLGSSLTVALLIYGVSSLRRIRWLLAAGLGGLALLLVLNQAPLGWIGLSLVAGVGMALPRPLNLSVLVGVLVTISVVRLLDLHRWQTDEALNVQRLMTEVVQAAPGLQPETPALLVIEGQPSDDALPFDISRQFEHALDLVMGDSRYRAFLCPYERSTWGWEDESCAFTGEGVAVSGASGAQLIPYSALVLLAQDGQRVVRLVEQPPAGWGIPAASGYDPWALLDPAAPPPPRLEGLFNPRPLIGR